MKINSLKKVKSGDAKCFIIFFSFFLMTYILFFHNVFTSDHVTSSFYEIQVGNLKESIVGGRFVNYFISIIYYILSFFNITHTENMWVLQVILIVFISLASVNLYNIFSFTKEKENINLWLMVIIALNFCNPFFVESFVYAGAELGIAIWIAVLSVKAFINNKKILSAIFLFISVSTYQSYIALFFIYTTTYLFFKYYNNMNKEMIVSYLKMFIIGGGVVLFNIVIVKLAVRTGYISSEVKKVNLTDSILDKIKDVFDHVSEIIIYTRNVLPIGLVLFVVAISIFIIFLQLKKEKINLKEMFILGLVLLMINMYPYAIAMVMDTIHLPPRVIWPIFSAISMTFLIAYYMLHTDGFLKKYLVVVTIFGVIVYFSTQTCILDEFISNAIDIYYAKAVESEIEEYERESGYEVTDIYVMHAKREQYYHTDLMHFDYAVMYNHKIQYNIWSDVEWLNFVNSEDYVEHTLDNSMQEEIFDKSNSEQAYLTINSSIQMKFEENRLYWLIY